MENQTSSKVSLTVIGALLTVYIVWGSTYLGIKFVNQTMPPLLSAGTRFMLAGIILLTWKILEKKPIPTFHEARNSAITGVLLFLMGNGAVVLALKRIDSGLAALIIALTPIIMVSLEMKFGRSAKPGWLTFAGMLLGLAGLGIIVNPFGAGISNVEIADVALILFGITCWAIGSIFMRNAKGPESDGMSASIQMLSGGIAMILVSLLLGEHNNIHFEAFSTASILSFFYLIFVGSIFAFSAYNYLLKATTPALTSTYAYVNPVVAIILGALIGGEIITSSTVLAAAVIIAGVLMITVDSNRRRKRKAKQVKQ